MFLFKLNIWNYIQHDLGFDPFSSETVLYFCYVLFCKFMNFNLLSENKYRRLLLWKDPQSRWHDPDTFSILLLFYCRCSYSILSYSLCHFTPPFFNAYKKCKKVYHIWPLALCKDTWLLYWKAGCLVDKTGSWPTTPLPRTVSNVPDKLNILQCLSRNWTVSMPRFSNRMLYLHCS